MKKFREMMQQDPNKLDEQTREMMRQFRNRMKEQQNGRPSRQQQNP